MWEQERHNYSRAPVLRMGACHHWQPSDVLEPGNPGSVNWLGERGWYLHPGCWASGVRENRQAVCKGLAISFPLTTLRKRLLQVRMA